MAEPARVEVAVARDAGGDVHEHMLVRLVGEREVEVDAIDTNEDGQGEDGGKGDARGAGGGLALPHERPAIGRLHEDAADQRDQEPVALGRGPRPGGQIDDHHHGDAGDEHEEKRAVNQGGTGSRPIGRGAAPAEKIRPEEDQVQGIEDRGGLHTRRYIGSRRSAKHCGAIAGR